MLDTILAFVEDFKRRHGRLPFASEVRRFSGLSKQGVRSVLRRLGLSLPDGRPSNLTKEVTAKALAIHAERARQRTTKVVDFIARYQERHGSPPSTSVIAKQLGMTTSGVYSALKRAPAHLRRTPEAERERVQEIAKGHERRVAEFVARYRAEFGHMPHYSVVRAGTGLSLSTVYKYLSKLKVRLRQEGLRARVVQTRLPVDYTRAPSEEPNPEEQVHRAKEIGRVKAALKRLSPREREIVRTRFLEVEGALLIALPPATLEKLRALLRERDVARPRRRRRHRCRATALRRDALGLVGQRCRAVAR